MLQTLRNFPAYLRASRHMSAGQLAAKVLRRAAGISTPALTRLELLSDPKLGSPRRVVKLFDLLEAQAIEHAGWSGIDLGGRNVMEIGCGALGGFSPIAIAREAASYAGIEPMWDDEVFFHPSVEKKYLAPVARHLGVDFGRFSAAMATRCRFDRGTLETWRPKCRADLVLSLSCLEHIDDLAAAARSLAALVSDETRQIHLVNFSNHRSKASPFDMMYTLPPEAFIARYGNLINLLRPSEVLATFRDAGFSARFVPVSMGYDALDTLKIDPYWQNRFSRDELATRTGLLLVDGQQ